MWIDHHEFFSDRDHGKDFYNGLVAVTSRHSPENGAATLRNNALARTGDRWRAISAFPMEQRVKEA
ncbi:hypothetical protein DF268_17565 [Streptomyces sp. V2]|uniref:hypothetical protein n=1 Tax=Streptomyces TaxID=1883 RepID=UPI0006EBD708|nr:MULTISPECIES: hypothetical protein [Streptomyces]PWG12198.1 hypothetical protein DF268_17565 [Streptomyces sp. V2]